MGVPVTERRAFKEQRRAERRLKIAEFRAEVARQRCACQPKRWTAEPGSELADLRVRVHKAYDILWEFGVMSRSEMYKQMATALHIPLEHCHIGMFDKAMCLRALAVRSQIHA